MAQNWAQSSTDFRGTRVRVEDGIRFKRETRLTFVVPDWGLTRQGISWELWIWRTGHTISEEREVGANRVDLWFPPVSRRKFAGVAISLTDLVSFADFSENSLPDVIERVLFWVATLSVKRERDKVVFTVAFKGVEGVYTAECLLNELRYWLKE